MFLPVFFCCYWVVAVRGSRIFYRGNQQAIHVADYCPKIDGCEEGTHVMCMYYNPDHPMSEICGLGQNYTLTDTTINWILDYMNTMRSAVAMGVEKGRKKNRVVEILPRAFGMMRLEWDEELAFFAQVWANQCMGFTWDLCHATKKFLSPGQIIEKHMYVFKLWESFNDERKQMPGYNGISYDKADWTLQKLIKEAYQAKQRVTKDMIVSYPDLEDDINKDIRVTRSYLNIIRGDNIRVGCGMSSFTDYIGEGQIVPVLKYSIELVCNFSGDLVVGNEVYRTAPLRNTTLCGCPPGYAGDKGCLCSPKAGPEPIISEPEPCNEGPCSPSVVLLPIITVEDAPPGKLYKLKAPFEKDSLEVSSVLEAPMSDMYATPRSDVRTAQNSNTDEFPLELTDGMRNIGKKYLIQVKNHYLNKKYPISENKNRIGAPVRNAKNTQHYNKKKPPTTRKDSIFTRVSKFQLATHTHHSNRKVYSTNGNSANRKTNRLEYENFTPRQDFSELKNLITEYLNEKHIRDKSTRTKLVNNFMDSIVKNNHQFGFENFNISLPSRSSEIINSFEETDNKLFELLNNLEQEVRRVDLNENIKEILHDKIRKIYDVVDHSDEPENSEVADLNYRDNVDREPKQIRDDHEIINNPIPNFEMMRPIRRKQNLRKNNLSRDRPNNVRNQKNYKFHEEDYNKESFPRELNKNHLRYTKIAKYDDLIRDDLYHRSKNRSPKQWDQPKLPNFYLNDEEDVSGVEETRHYREKLNQLDGNLQKAQRYHIGHSHHTRPVIMSEEMIESMRPTNHMHSLYLPERAKYLQNF